MTCGIFPVLFLVIWYIVLQFVLLDSIRSFIATHEFGFAVVFSVLSIIVFGAGIWSVLSW